jgi:hypothetical protein
LIKYAGPLTLEAVDALRFNFAVNKECMKYKSILGEYQDIQGIGEMSFKSPILCFATGHKIGTLKKVKTP